MSPVRVRDDSSPWSFFLPILLAVAMGILLADMVRHVAGAAFGEDEPVVAVAAAPPDTSGDAGEGEDPDAGAGDGAAVVTVGQSSGGDVVLLPGPVSAMRDGAERACINDTIALRRPNGWEQGLEDSAPLRCRASSP